VAPDALLLKSKKRYEETEKKVNSKDTLFPGLKGFMFAPFSNVITIRVED